MTELQFVITMENLTCSECGIGYAIASNFLKQRRENTGGDAKSWHCPNGHMQHFSSTEVVRLRRELEREKAAREAAENRARAEERIAASARRQAKAERTKREKVVARVGAGVCPLCHRTFSGLARHMAQKHPDVAPPRAVQAEEHARHAPPSMGRPSRG